MISMPLLLITSEERFVYMDRNEMSKYVQETFSKTGSVVKMLKAEEAKEKK